MRDREREREKQRETRDEVQPNTDIDKVKCILNPQCSIQPLNKGKGKGSCLVQTP